MSRAELTGRDDAVRAFLPDRVHEEALAVIDAVADTPDREQSDPAEAFGTASLGRHFDLMSRLPGLHGVCRAAAWNVSGAAAQRRHCSAYS
ncbi:hypothetical protein ABZS76_16345 [Streptomyces sp. NPDC005562]|uniref:hypothetical protein n=1 Tax=Streptomyces sp. NPDC005562 TaxID=3154890 RepID=UPI0033A46B95